MSPEPDQPADAWQRRERLLQRFEDAWLQGRRPAIPDFLPVEPDERRSALIELVHTDLEYRLRAGEPARVEEYLHRYADLGQDREALVGLLAAEYDLRRTREPSLTVQEYLSRFPQLGADLREHLPPGEPAGNTGAGYLPDHPTDPYPPPSETTGEAPESAGRYRRVRFHARGGIGEVHLAQDQELRREVALKRIQPRHGTSADARARFLREAEITARLEHPGVVPVYGLVQDAEGQPCYAMRFIEGETFQDAITRAHQPGLPDGERELQFRQLLTRLVTVCNTIAYAHSRGVIHRDVKPANILLGCYGETLLVDWGLAKGEAGGPESGESGTDGSTHASAPPQSLSLTRQGQVVGTPAYMSPEQAAGRWDAVGPASDVYSLGATLYHLLTGQSPLHGQPLDEVLEKVQRGALPAPRAVYSQVPPALDAVCRKAMATEPGQRYPSALALADDVEHWLADAPVGAWREPWTVRARRWARRHRGLVTGGAAAAVAALVSLGVATVFLTAAFAREHQAKVEA
jgi:serine/threonine-protein kinase